MVYLDNKVNMQWRGQILCSHALHQGLANRWGLFLRFPQKIVWRNSLNLSGKNDKAVDSASADLRYNDPPGANAFTPLLIKIAAVICNHWLRNSILINTPWYPVSLLFDAVYVVYRGGSWYIPSEDAATVNIEEFAKTYYHMGLQNKECLGCLAHLHGIIIGIKSPKGLINQMRIIRKINHLDRLEFATYILQHNVPVQASYMDGYRWMQAKCVANGFRVTLKSIWILHIIDHEDSKSGRQGGLEDEYIDVPGPTQCGILTDTIK